MLVPICFGDTSGYCANITNTIAFEQSVMSEVICHDVMAVQKPDIFSQVARLANACKPTKLLQQLVAKHFNILDDTEVTTCLEAKRSPAGSCQKGNFVFLKEAGLKLFAKCGCMWPLGLMCFPWSQLGICCNWIQLVAMASLCRLKAHISLRLPIWPVQLHICNLKTNRSKSLSPCRKGNGGCCSIQRIPAKNVQKEIGVLPVQLCVAKGEVLEGLCLKLI